MTFGRPISVKRTFVSLVERRKDAQAFACAAQEMRSRWERLDGHVRAVVAREFASATGYALQSDGTIRIGTKTIGRISTSRECGSWTY